MKTNELEASIFRRTLSQLKKGFYLVDDERVPIRGMIKLRYNSILYTEYPDLMCDSSGIVKETKYIYHYGESLLDLLRKVKKSVFLCSCSSLNPGGGVAQGREGLEEYIVARSSLYYSLSSYSDNYIDTDSRKRGGQGYPLNCRSAIFSPSVCIWKDDEGEIINNPYLVNIVTIPPVLVTPDQKDEDGKVKKSVLRRIKGKLKLFLSIAVEQKYERLIIPHFGCGPVYGNNYDQLLELLRELVSNEFKNRFTEIHLI